jgi:hypothetical protein
MQPYITRTYLMKGEQQKVLHKGTNDKVNAFITLLYPLNKIKFITGKTRNSDDFINHLKNIKRYEPKKSIRRFILAIDNASFHASKKTRQYVERQSKWLTVVYLQKRAPYLNPLETMINRNLNKDICAIYCYEPEEDMLGSIRKYLRRMGCWPKI